MPAPKPDTSNANVARVLREAAEDFAIPCPCCGATNEATDGEHVRLLALADALDQQAAAPMWEERVAKALPIYKASRDAYSQPARKLVASILRAAFPELSPKD